MQITIEKLKPNNSKREWLINFNVRDPKNSDPFDDPPVGHEDYDLLKRIEEKLGELDTSICFTRITISRKTNQLANLELYI